MKRRKRRHDRTAPSLFPFLAVLICTMGAIILLLVLVVKNADVRANAATKKDQEKLAALKQEWNDKLELQNSVVGSLHRLRPDLKARLETEKSEFGHLADHVTRLQKELDGLQSSLEALNATKEDTASIEKFEDEIKQLKQQIAVAKTEFISKQKELADAKPMFAIVPHAGGGNGTYRRPIFVECDEHGVTLQPYGITLLPADFPRPLGPDNPLDLALLMIRDYWNQVDPNQTEGQPYPLFVVRPSGSKAFAAARKAMKSWVDEFGYELVTAELQIKYPPADPSFQQRLQAAVDRARQEQQQRIAAINRQQALNQIRRLDHPNGSSQGFRASSLGGGFVRERNGSGSRNGTGGTSRFQTGSASDSRTKSQFASQRQQSFGQDSRPNRQRNANDFQPLTGQRNSSFTTLKNQSGPRANTENGQGGPNSGPSAEAGKDAVPALPPESLARQRGKDWALPSKASNSIQVRKPIKVQVTKDGIQIVEIGRGIKNIPFGKSTATAIPGLIETVWKHIDAWGIAGVNSYWKPTLNLYVAPDAQSRFKDLEILLSGSGLDLRRM